MNGLSSEGCDAQRQILDSNNNATRAKIDSMIATRCERLKTERSAAGPKAHAASFRRRYVVFLAVPEAGSHASCPCLVRVQAEALSSATETSCSKMGHRAIDCRGGGKEGFQRGHR